jgi:hypothetical protein
MFSNRRGGAKGGPDLSRQRDQRLASMESAVATASQQNEPRKLKTQARKVSSD